MRVVSLLTHSTTLLVLQQAVIVWFLVDFFLARESATTHKLLNEHVTRSSSAIDTIEQIEAVSKDLQSSLSCDDLLLNPPAFDKLIFVVVDALGSEFIRSIPSTPPNDDHNHGTKSPLKMPFLEQSLASHQAMGFVAKAATPTVTMPRIKALVSGTIPSFMDIVYNLASNTADFNEDNILSAARTRGKTIVFYGDDTWLSLFDKSIFKRSRETLSFYASDHTSVDTNVTEMALPETNRDPIDWDYMILHYLGLDHIGHVYGTNESPLIDKKLLEMDSVIKEMYNNMAAKNHKTLFVICGDHGMSSEGNHGGGTRLESETAMLFLPINQQLTITESHDNKEVRIAQIDLASTLATLTGLPIPTTSRGVIIKPLLKGIWHTDVKRLTCASINNLKQLSLLLDDSEFSSPGGLGIQVLQLLHRMSKNSSIENEQSFAQQCIELARALQANLVRVVATRSNNFLVILVVVFVVLLSIINLRRACNRLLMPLMSHTERLTCLGSVLVPVILLNSTDFIEMEHIFWPLYSITILALFCLVALRSHRLRSIIQDIEHFRVVLFVITFLIAALWNHISLLGHHDWGWSLPVISTMILCNYTRQTSKLSGKQSISPFVFGLLMLTTKFIEETSENHQMVAVLQLITLITLVLAGVAHLYISFRKDYDLQSTSIVLKLATYWMWWIFLLSRSRNYLFLIANVVMEVSLNSIANSFKFNPIARAIVYLQFSNNAFFGQGNSNLFSTLDIKPAFYGQTQYSIILAVPLVACSTFGSLIYWYIKLFQRVQGEKEQERMSIRSELIDETNTSNLIPEGTKDAIKDFVDMRNFLTIAYYLFVCMVLRDHLFIWSVLSPKLVYLFMATLTTRLMTTMISNLPHLIVRALGHRDKFGGVKYKLISD